MVVRVCVCVWGGGGGGGGLVPIITLHCVFLARHRSALFRVFLLSSFTSFVFGFCLFLFRLWSTFSVLFVQTSRRMIPVSETSCP